MNFVRSIKQLIACINCAKKKKDLSVIIPFKKEILPFLSVVREEGLIFRFVVKKKVIEVFLKKVKGPFRCNFEKPPRRSELEATFYRDPTSVVIVSTAPRGVVSQGLRHVQGGPVLLHINEN